MRPSKTLPPAPPQLPPESSAVPYHRTFNSGHTLEVSTSFQVSDMLTVVSVAQFRRRSFHTEISCDSPGLGCNEPKAFSHEQAIANAEVVFERIFLHSWAAAPTARIFCSRNQGGARLPKRSRSGAPPTARTRIVKRSINCLASAKPHREA